jgi:NitT/TauT family transport system ATP-binding protein
MLLVDEPFAALDAQTKIILQEELMKIREATRKTVVYITHSIEEALVLGDRVVVFPNKDAPIHRASSIVAIAMLGGLHHHYVRI